MAGFFVLGLVALFVFLANGLDSTNMGEEEGKAWDSYMVEYKRQKEKEVIGYHNFSCDGSLDVPPPENIHSLAPKYVGVVAALGDSLTAACGAEADRLGGVATEYRGVSFSIGGDNDLEKVLTLPNVVKTFNPTVFGASTGVSKIHDEQGSLFNVAIPGSRAKHIPKQADMLIERLQKHPELLDAWKLVTIFIGANDICACEKISDPDHTVSTWVADISKTLTILSDSLTKTFVNLVSVPMVGEIRAYDYYATCAAKHSLLCPCIMKSHRGHEKTDELIRKYQHALYQLPDQFQSRSDFTVVLQPFMENINVPYTKDKKNQTVPDLSYLAPDCFHFSQKSHAFAAAELWNNMLQPIGKKTNVFDPTSLQLDCPEKESPYLKTPLNSE